MDVMRPQFGATSPAALVNAIRPDGTAKLGLFRTLNASRRICADCRGPNAMLLTSDRSALKSPGPTSVFRPRLPRVFAAGSANALMSQYRSGPPSVGLEEEPGFRSGRSAPSSRCSIASLSTERRRRRSAIRRLECPSSS